MRWLVRDHVKRCILWLWCLGWLVIAVKSLQPAVRLPFDLSDKTVHIATYAAMAAAVAGFCHEPRGLLRWSATAVVLGGLLELGQHFAPGRSMALGDFVADAAGAIVGALIALLWLVAVVRPLRPAASA